MESQKKQDQARENLPFARLSLVNWAEVVKLADRVLKKRVLAARVAA